MSSHSTAQLVRVFAEVTGQNQSYLQDLLDGVGGAELDWLGSLIEHRVLPESDCYRIWAEAVGLQFFALDERTLDRDLLHRLPLDVARRYGAVAVEEADSGELVVALSNPFNIMAVDSIQEVTGRPVLIAIATPTAIQRALTRQERGQTGIEGLISRIHKSEADSDILADQERLKMVAGDDAVVQIVDYLIDEALRAGASDIHLEPQRDHFRVRLRVDGELETLHRFPVGLQRPVCSRVKVLANMDIGESRKPQDGRFVLNEDGSVELRVSTLPSVFGEKVVMRVLDRSQITLDLDQLGIAPTNLELFRQGFSCPNGLVLLTGPTGSGKTTTLYAALSELNHEAVNVITVEDPVEYDLPGTTQVQVDTKADRTFAKALRSILRQDPDVVMVGEIRDRETAEIAVQAALTGHMVLSTLHTNDAPGAVYRLLDMGIEPYLLGPALRCVVGQRLVARVCPDCAAPAELAPEIVAAAGLDPGAAHTNFVHGRGCGSCRGKGRRGRTAVHEVLSIDSALGRMISAGTPEGEFLQAARCVGYRPMMADGVERARNGEICLEDLVAVARRK